MNTRLMAARVVNDVTDGRSMTESLSHYLPQLKDARDRALVQAMSYGVCRFYTRLDVALSHLLTRPMNEKDSDVHALILVGLYQLMEMRVAEHAAVSETVNASEKLDKPWSRGLINAVLREYLRNKKKVDAQIKEDEEALYAHPIWWVQKIKKNWPEQWQAILNANNEHPPFSLRVNAARQSRDEYFERVAGWVKDRSEASETKPVGVTLIPETTSGIILTTPVQTEELPGFTNGNVSVQDGAAQLAVELLQLEKDQRVLDACAAPGGKLLHILESEPELAEVVAVEKDKERTKQIHENLLRAGLSATIHTQDVNAVSTWWDGEAFDRILLDAPCSASGVIRRHPDIKLLRQPTDLIQFAREQQTLLRTLWQTLKPGGILLYATCSIFPEENVDTIKAFLAANSDAVEDKIDAAWGVACEAGRQILPGQHNMDGFYYARLKKQA